MLNQKKEMSQMQVIITESMRVCTNTICIILDTTDSKSILVWIVNLIGNNDEDSGLMNINTISISSGTVNNLDGMITHII
jgi:hypothetical protein